MSRRAALIKLAGLGFANPDRPHLSMFNPRLQEYAEERRAIDKSDQEAEEAGRALAELAGEARANKYLRDLRNKRLPNPMPWDYANYLIDRFSNALKPVTDRLGRFGSKIMPKAPERPKPLDTVGRYYRGENLTPGSEGARRMEGYARTV